MIVLEKEKPNYILYPKKEKKLYIIPKKETQNYINIYLG